MNSRLLLGVTAFTVSFALHLVVSRQPQVAVGAGLLTLPAVYIATAVRDRRRQQRATERIEQLKEHIYALQQRRQEAYLAFTAMLEEKDRVAMTLNSLQLQLRQWQLASTPEPVALPAASEPPESPRLLAAPKPLSWNLSEPVTTAGILPPPPHSPQLPTTQLQDPTSGTEVKPSLPLQLPSPQLPPTQIIQKPDCLLADDTSLAESRSNLHILRQEVRSLQQELEQLQTRLSENRQLRHSLATEITELKQQKRQLETEVKSLRQKLHSQEQQQRRLEQAIASLETQKQNLSKPQPELQTSHRALQQQINQQQAELQTLNQQVGDRQQEKQTLEQQLAELKQQQQQQQQRAQQELQRLEAQIVEQTTRKHKLERQVTELAASLQASSISSQANPPALPSTEPNRSQITPDAAKAPLQPNGKALTADPSAQAGPVAQPNQDLPDEWMEFLSQLPEYELEVLRVIVETPQPGAMIRRIAEENLTMPELLIDSINERAIETVGDLVIDAESGMNSAKIMREHLKAIKKLLRTYEFLMQ